MKDPEFIADATKSKLDLSPLSGEDLEKTVPEIYGAEPNVVASQKTFSSKTSRSSQEV
jgi:hypothetical protein